MTAGQFLDRAINAALIKAADAVNRLMAVSFPMHGLYTSALSDPRAGGSADGAPPAPNPPIGAGGVFQTPEEK